MQIRIILCLVFHLTFSLSQGQSVINKSAFYSTLASQNTDEIDAELNNLKNIKGKEAFEGALLMKKSGLVSNPADKFKLFKLGHTKLEFAIKNDSTNAEFRFLRLMVQENAAKIVNYSSEIRKDASYLRKNYKKLSPAVQKAVFDYSKNSKELSKEDFKNGAHE
jgi:hypothetical protein